MELPSVTKQWGTSHEIVDLLGVDSIGIVVQGHLRPGVRPEGIRMYCKVHYKVLRIEKIQMI